MSSSTHVFGIEKEYRKCLCSTHNSDCYRSPFVSFLSREIRRQGFGVEFVKKWIEMIISRIFFFPCYMIKDGASFQLLPLRSIGGFSRDNTFSNTVVIVIQFHLASLHLSSQVAHSLCESLIRTSHILTVNDTAEFFDHFDGATLPLEFWSLSLSHNDLGDECVPTLLELLHRKEEKWYSWPKSSEERANSTSELSTFSGVWLDLFDGNRFSAPAIAALESALRKKPPKLCESSSASTVANSSTATALPTEAARLEECERNISSPLGSPSLLVLPEASDTGVDNAPSLSFHEASLGDAKYDHLLQNEVNAENDYRKRAFLLLSSTPSCEYLNKNTSLEQNITSSVLASTSPTPEAMPTNFSNAVPSPNSGRLASVFKSEKEIVEPFINTFHPGEHVPPPACNREDDKQDGRGHHRRRRSDAVESRPNRGSPPVLDESVEKKVLKKDVERSESRFIFSSLLSTPFRNVSEDNLAHRYRSPWIEGGVVDLSYLTVDAPACQNMIIQNEESGDKVEVNGRGILSVNSAEHFKLVSERYIQKNEDVDNIKFHSTSLDQKRDLLAEQHVEDTRKSIWDVLSFLRGNQQLIGDRKTVASLHALFPASSAASGLSVITILDMSHNNLSSIPANALPPTLLRLDLSHNTLSSLEGGAWLKSCRMLAVLNLRYNKLGYQEKDVVDATPESLQKSEKKSVFPDNESRRKKKGEPHEAGVTVSSSSPLRGALQNTPHLTHLFLGHNYLTSLDGIFGARLLVLHTLDISYNRITSLNELRPLSLFHSLYQLIVKNNPLRLPFSSTLSRPEFTSQSGRTTPLSVGRVPHHSLHHDAASSMSSSPGRTRSSPFHAAQLRPVLRNMLPQLTFADDVNLRDYSSISEKIEGKNIGTTVERGAVNQNCSKVPDGIRMKEENTRVCIPEKFVKVAGSIGRIDNDDEKRNAGILMSGRDGDRNKAFRHVVRESSEPMCGVNVKSESTRNSNGLYSSAKHERHQHLALLRSSHPESENLTDYHRESKSSPCENLRECEKSAQRKSPSAVTKFFNSVAQSPDKKSRETLVNELIQEERNFTNRLRSSIQEEKENNSLYGPFSLENVRSGIKSNSELRKGERAGHEQDKKCYKRNDSFVQEQQQGLAPVNGATNTISRSSFSEVWRKKLVEEQKEVQGILFSILSTLESQQKFFWKALKNEGHTLQLIISLLKNNSKYRSQLLQERELTLQFFFFKEKNEISFSRETPKGKSLLAPTVVPKEMDFILLGRTTNCKNNTADSAAFSEENGNSFSWGDLRALLFACEDAKACLRFLVQFLKENTKLLYSLENFPRFSGRRIDSNQISKGEMFQMVSEMEIQLFKNIKAIRGILGSN